MTRPGCRQAAGRHRARPGRGRQGLVDGLAGRLAGEETLQDGGHSRVELGPRDVQGAGVEQQDYDWRVARCNINQSQGIERGQATRLWVTR